MLGVDDRKALSKKPPKARSKSRKGKKKRKGESTSEEEEESDNEEESDDEERKAMRKAQRESKLFPPSPQTDVSRGDGYHKNRKSKT